MYKRLTPSAIYRYKYYRLSPSKDFTRHYPREVSDASERDVYIFNRINPRRLGQRTTTRRFHHVFGRRVIHTNDQSTVFLGTFQEVHVLLKYCYNTKFFRDFKQEARVYKARLGGLQEEVVLFRYYLAEDELYGPYSLLPLGYRRGSLTRPCSGMET